MDLLADSLLIGGAIAAAFYCWVLSVRVRSLKDLDKGLGGAIAGLSRQVDEMQTTLKAAKSYSETSKSELESLATRAEAASDQLRDLLDQAELSERRRKPSATVSNFPRPDIEETLSSDPETAEPIEIPATDAPDEDSITLAQQLQRDIRQRIAGRDDLGDRDDFVRALQDILAASK